MAWGLIMDWGFGRFEIPLIREIIMKVKTFVLSARGEIRNGLLKIQIPFSKISIPSLPYDLHECQLCTEIEFEDSDPSVFELTYNLILPGRGHAKIPAHVLIDAKGLKSSGRKSVIHIWNMADTRIAENGDYTFRLIAQKNIIATWILSVSLDGA